MKRERGTGMIYEKSCGAVVYAVTSHRRLYLVEEMRGGHFALCKGHVEGQETEVETAKREILEETGLTVDPDTRFRKRIQYSPYVGCKKEVIYFVAKAETTHTVVQPEEVKSICWLPFPEALKRLTYPNDREVLQKADRYLSSVL